MRRRTFISIPAMIAGAVGLARLVTGCGPASVYEITVASADDGRSVFQATSRFYEVRVDTRTWQNASIVGLAKVTAIDGFRSDKWIFEVNGREYNGTIDAAEATRVRTGDTITWRQV